MVLDDVQRVADLPTDAVVPTDCHGVPDVHLLGHLDGLAAREAEAEDDGEHHRKDGRNHGVQAALRVAVAFHGHYILAVHNQSGIWPSLLPSMVTVVLP